MSAHTKLSPAKAERIRVLAEKLAAAAAKYKDAANELRARENGDASVRHHALNAARAARRNLKYARADLIAECEAPDQEGGGA